MDECRNSPLHSIARSKDLKKRGSRFVGSTIRYAFMQAVGTVNDRLVERFRCSEVAMLGGGER